LSGISNREQVCFQQGSVLGPKTFVLYAEDGTDVFHSHRIFYHLYADDMQMIEHRILSEAKAIVTGIQNCVSDVRSWCSSRRLQLNSSKTEIMWFMLTYATLTR